MNPAFLALSIGAMAIGAVVLLLAVSRLFALLRETEITRVPVVAETPVTFNAPGTYVLHVEHPRLSFALGNAEFALRDAMSAEDVRSSPVIFRTTVSGVSSARVSVRDFDVPRAGVYRLLVKGVDPAADVSHSALIITRPFGAALFGLILAIVFGGFCLIGGLVFTALQYTGKM